VAPPPALVPLQLRSIRFPNRIAVTARPTETAREGTVADELFRAMAEAGRIGAGLVLTPAVAVRAEGRESPGSPGLYTKEHVQTWSSAVGAVRDNGPSWVGIRLSHAGRRASCRPRGEGVDRPLREGGWPVVSASPIPYGPDMPVPRALDEAGLEEVVEAFAAASGWAADAGFDLVILDMAQGTLLASFLSPLSNRREDAYGGSLERRLAFPLEVLQAVRAAWPQDRPAAAAITAVDGARGGAGLDEAVTVARALAGAGCDLIEVLAGQTTLGAMPGYDPYELVSYSDRVRNEARVPTLAFGPITAIDQVSTIVAAGRADLCHLLAP
jgi:anthraniloyl-CoA monooxygenase